MKRKTSNIRIGLIGLLAFLAFLAVGINVYVVTIQGKHLNSGRDISQYTSAANTKTSVITAKRGYIYDRNGNVIAQDNETYTIYAVLSSSRPNSGSKPAYVVDVKHTAEVLAPLLDIAEETLVNYMSQEKYQVEFGSAGRNLSLSVKEEIESYDLPGIEFTKTISRNYPLGAFASHLIGFAQYDETLGGLVGKMGIEAIYDETLNGENGYKKYQVNTEGYTLPGGLSETVEAKDGSDVYLTLDRGIQERLELSLQETMQEQNAEKAWAAVMEVETGKLLAWGNYPTFDPTTLLIEDYTNLGLQYAYEPGSTMKTFTYAAAIDSGVYNGTDTFNSGPFYMGIRNGEAIRIYDSDRAIETITNARNKNWGEISYDLGYRYSSNVGIASLLTNYLKPSVYEEYLEKFGFFQKVGLDGLNETTGVKNYNYPIEKLTLGFGQGSSVTMIQLLQAYTAIFNDGVMVKPYVVQQVKNSNTGAVEYLAETTVVGTPISASTAKQMQGLMYDVVNASDGSGKHYRVNEVEVIGKTGTAQVFVDGTYSGGKVITSVMLAFPADDPKIMVYYAFQSDYNENLHVYTNPITNLVQKAAVNAGLTTPSKSLEENENEYHDTTVYTMPSLLNHSLSYAEKQLEDMEVHLVLLGNGSQVINQYPASGSLTISGQRIFLLTSDQQITMPDLTGYSRKEVIALWDLCGLAVSIKGDGTVTHQSIPENTLIYENSLLEVTLE